MHPFPEIDVTERFSAQWDAASPDGLCTGNNSALLSFRTPRHDYWGGGGDLELLSVDASLLDGDMTVEEVRFGLAVLTGSRDVPRGFFQSFLVAYIRVLSSGRIVNSEVS